VPLYSANNGGTGSRGTRYSFFPTMAHRAFRGVRETRSGSSRATVAFIASGDLSTVCSGSRPEGFNPKAHLFAKSYAATAGKLSRRIVDGDQDVRKARPGESATGPCSSP